MTNEQIAASCELFYPAFKRLFALAWLNVEDSVQILGIPTKVERANMMHLALRTELRQFCDQLDPVAMFVEEPDGQGLDCMVIDTGSDSKLALRWGRYGDGTIKRNPTQRTRGVQQDGLLPFAMAEELTEEISSASIGYDVTDDYTEGGIPAWWLQRLVLLRERRGASEFIQDVCAYDKPERGSDDALMSEESIELRISERVRIGRIADRLRRKLR